MNAISTPPKATMTQSNITMTQTELAFSLKGVRENYGMDKIYYIIYMFTVSRDGKFSNMLRRVTVMKKAKT